MESPSRAIWHLRVREMGGLRSRPPPNVLKSDLCFYWVCPHLTGSLSLLSQRENCSLTTEFHTDSGFKFDHLRLQCYRNNKVQSTFKVKAPQEIKVLNQPKQVVKKGWVIYNKIKTDHGLTSGFCHILIQNWNVSLSGRPLKAAR